MEINEVVNIISNQGLAIFMCVYYVIKQNKSTEQNTQALIELKEAIKTIKEEQQ